jgi:hypothetical protein
MLVDGTGQLVSRTTCFPPAKPQPRRSVLPAQPRRSARIRKVCTSLPCCCFLRIVGFGFRFALPLSSFFCDLLAWFVSWGFFHASRERGKEERMNERTRSHRASLPPLPFSSTLIIDRRMSPSTDEEPTTPSISKKHFLLSSCFF